MPPMHKQNITNKWAQISVFCFCFWKGECELNSSMAATFEKGTITIKSNLT